MRIWPWSKLADMRWHIEALAQERNAGWAHLSDMQDENQVLRAQGEAWRQLYLKRDGELAAIRSARSAASTKAAATLRAKVMRKAEEMRGEGL